MDGRGPQPFEHFIGRLSEEFGGALPTVIMAERARLPTGFLEQIIEYRSYAATKQAYDRQQNPKATSEMWDLVKLIEFEIAGEDLAAHG